MYMILYKHGALIRVEITKIKVWKGSIRVEITKIKVWKGLIRAEITKMKVWKGYSLFIDP